MNVSSLLFILIYLPIFIGLMYFIKNNTIRNYLILIFSLLFYILNDLRYFILLISISLISYIVGLKVKNNKRLYFIYIFILVLLLAIFKYGNKISILNIDDLIMPLGISFYIFTSISYVSDVYYQKIEKESNYIYLLSYLSFFITITSGPILRYKTFKDYLDNKEINASSISIGLRRFIIGLFKKVVIANTIAHGASVCFDNASLQPALLAWFGAICFMLELYYDFSGYSDIAIGIAYMIGYKIPENFNDPYTADSIRDFWHRWHISLSSWFKDYVYIPLGGSRVSTVRWLINILIVWCLTGIWHGSTINYLLWGLWNALFLILEKFIFSKIKCPNILRILFTQSIVLLGFVIFHTNDLTYLLNYLTSMFNGGPSFSIFALERLDIFYLWPYILIAILFIIPKVKGLFYSLNDKYPYFYDLLMICLLFISIVFIINGSYSSFIYAGF